MAEKKKKQTVRKKTAPKPTRDSTKVDFSDKLVDYVHKYPSGYPVEESAWDTSDALAALGTREFPDTYWIEPADWKDFARQNDKDKTHPEDYRNRFTHQGNSHECTCHALSQNFEIAWNRQAFSKKFAVYTSPLSVYAQANPRRWGGSSMQYTLGIAMERGILPSWNGPGGPGTQKDKYEHTLNETAGHSRTDRAGVSWVSLRNFPTGWKETAKHFMPLEVINPRSEEEIICLLLRGIAVSVGRYGHAIPYVQAVWRDGSWPYAKYSDSYDVHRFDSKRAQRAAVGGAYAIVSTTHPDEFAA